MRRIRLFTVTAAVGLTAVLSPAAVSVAHAAAGRAQAAASPQITPGVSMWSRPWATHSPVSATCPNARDLHVPGEMYQVKSDGIHIRSTPGGAVETGISKGTLFANDWVVRNIGGHQCVATADGQNWVLGVSQTGSSGWVGQDYLTRVRPLNR